MTPAGPPVPALHKPVYGEDFSRIIRAPRRIRKPRNESPVRVLS